MRALPNPQSAAAISFWPAPCGPFSFDTALLTKQKDLAPYAALQAIKGKIMGIECCFHANHGGEFLGLRVSRRGLVEVVYDNGPQNRHIWRVMLSGMRASTLTRAEEKRLSEALQIAAGAPRVLPSLHSEMKKRAITLEKLVH